MSEEKAQETKTLDSPQSDKTPIQIENPNLQDAELIKYLNEIPEEDCVIDDCSFPKTLEIPNQDCSFPKTLEIPDVPQFQNLDKSLYTDRAIDDFLLGSIGFPEDRGVLDGWSSPPRGSGGSFLSLFDSVGRKRGRDHSGMRSAGKVSKRSGKETELSRFSSQLWNDPEPCPVGAGLANMGNTCFVNAILQCFTHTVPLVQGLLSLKHDPSIHGGEFCVLCAVRSQIELSLRRSGQVISPCNLVDNLSHISSFFGRSQQEDAHELLQCLLDKLDSNWLTHEGNERDSSSSSSSSSSDSLVKQIFGGRTVSQLRCRRCGHTSDTYEPLIGLSLEIENVDNLESALKSFTKVESMEDTEKFTCEGCKEQVLVEKQLMVDQAPSAAALHFKRFKNNGIEIEKIDKKVEYPLELDLKPYTKGAEDGNEELKYELYGVVVHVGLSITAGHYFCYIRTAPDTWYLFDDSKVTRVSEATALCQDAYILFYARKGTEHFSSFFEKWKALSVQKSTTISPKSVFYDMDFPSTSSRPSVQKSLTTSPKSAVYDVDLPAPSSRPSVQTSPTTSPKSAIYDMDLPSTSSRPGVSIHDCEPAGKRDAAQGTSIEPSGGLIPDRIETPLRVNNQDSTPANRTSAPSLSGHFDHDGVKMDKPNFDSQFSSRNKIIGEMCSPSHVEKTVEIDVDPCTPPRSLSPNIYSDEEPAEARYLIPVKHLKVEDKTLSAKKTMMDKAKNDVKRKEAVRYMSRSMPSGRRDMLMAAMIGPQSQSDNSALNKKRRKQVAPIPAPFLDEMERPSPKKRAKISPKRVLRPVAA